MENFSEKVRKCEMAFQSGKPYWHAYTSGRETSILFRNVGEFTLAMNVIAQASALLSDVRVIAFEVMSNHFHFVLSGAEDRIKEFYAFIRKRLSHLIPELKVIDIQLKPIESLQSLRNTITYVNRNGYVADPSHTPFSYPWGTGRYYFQTVPGDCLYGDLSIPQRRKMFRGRSPEMPDDWVISNGYVSPASYCRLDEGKNIFGDAHQYFYLLSKNVEANSDINADIDGGDFLTDTELYAQLYKILQGSYGVSRPSELSKPQKLDIARKLHYDWHSSNGQIRRLLYLTQYEVDSLFPMSKSSK